MRILLIGDEDNFIESALSELDPRHMVDVAKDREEGAYFSQIHDYNVVLLEPKLVNYIAEPWFEQIFQENTLTLDSLRIDFKNREIFIGSRRVKLPRKEYDLFEYLVLNKGRVLSKERLLEYVWRDDSRLWSNTVAVHISRLRSKVEKPFGLKLIHTVRGFGYRFDIM